MNRRSFFKLLGIGTVASFFKPSLLTEKTEKINQLSEDTSTIAFNWEAKSDWGLITSVGVFNSQGDLIFLDSVNIPNVVETGHMVHVQVNFHVVIKRRWTIGLFIGTKEIEGKGYYRKPIIKEWWNSVMI